MKLLRPILMWCAVALATGCNAYRLDPPKGFAQVAKEDRGARMKSGDDVGLRVDVFDNVEGGTLAFWGEDLVRKLGQRDYTLVSHRPIESDNGKPGSQFNFSYVNPDDEEKFYSVALFVTDEYRIVLQLAGDQALSAKYQPRLPEIASQTKVRGCKLLTDICEGEQPQVVPGQPKPPAKAERDTALADKEPSEPAG